MQHFELKIKIAYDMNGESPATIMALLYQAAQHLADEGMLSGHTQAEVESWAPQVKMVGDGGSSQVARFKCTDERGNVAYIHRVGSGYLCTLANGIPAAFSYAVGHCPDETGLKFKLQDAKDDAMRLRIIQIAAGPGRKVEMF